MTAVRWTSADVREGALAFGGLETWYRVAGRLDGDRVPLVVLHGGPGGTSDYLDPLLALSERGRPVVQYDQVGNGRSSHLRDRDASSLTIELFLAQLDGLLAHLGLEHGYHLLGHSWGGMLAAEHGLLRPPGLRSLVLASTPASIDEFVAATRRLRAQLPDGVDGALRRLEATGVTDGPEYEVAAHAFYAQHVCRLADWPEELTRSFAQVAADPTVYLAMNGPSEFDVTGSIAGWSLIERAAGLVVPTLLASGRHDEVAPEAVRPLADALPDARWRVFEGSSHVPHMEEPAEFLAVVRRFLDDHEG